MLVALIVLVQTQEKFGESVSILIRFGAAVFQSSLIKGSTSSITLKIRMIIKI